MPKLIYYDEAAHQAASRNAAEMADRLTALLSQFAALALPSVAPVATADLPDLLADPSAWLVNRIFGSGTFSFGGMPVNPQKALELIERPAGFDEFIASAKETARWLTGVQMSYELRSASSYAVGAGGQVHLAATVVAQLENRFKHYATTSAQEALLADLTAVCAVLNRLRVGVLAGGALLGDASGLLSKALIEPLHGGGDVRPNPAFITRSAH